MKKKKKDAASQSSSLVVIFFARWLHRREELVNWYVFQQQAVEVVVWLKLLLLFPSLVYQKMMLHCDSFYWGKTSVLRICLYYVEVASSSKNSCSTTTPTVRKSVKKSLDTREKEQQTENGKRRKIVKVLL